MSDYSLKIELNEELNAVDVIVREKVDGDFNAIDTGSFGVDGVHDDISSKVALYGLSKLLQDRSSSVPTGPDKLAAMNEVFAQLATGEWNKERTRGASVVSAEVEALAAIKGHSIPDIQRALKGYTAEQKDKIFASDVVKTKAAEIRAAREGSDEVAVDLADMLG